jgi:hypothetical protein
MLRCIVWQKLTGVSEVLTANGKKIQFIIALTMDAVITFETFVKFYDTTRRNIL